jgi:hypothetical protein
MPTKVWEIIKQPLKPPDFVTDQVLRVQRQRSGAVSTVPLSSIQHPWGGDCIPYPKLFQAMTTPPSDNNP